MSIIAYLTTGVCREKCEIEVTDYSATTIRTTKLTNSEFVELMGKPDAGREAWTRVRWINIGGISWDVMSALSLEYCPFFLSLFLIVC